MKARIGCPNTPVANVTGKVIYTKYSKQQDHGTKIFSWGRGALAWICRWCKKDLAMSTASNQIRVVAFNVPQLTHVHFYKKKIKSCKIFVLYL